MNKIPLLLFKKKNHIIVPFETRYMPIFKIFLPHFLSKWFRALRFCKQIWIPPYIFLFSLMRAKCLACLLLPYFISQDIFCTYNSNCKPHKYSRGNIVLRIRTPKFKVQYLQCKTSRDRSGLYAGCCNISYM